MNIEEEDDANCSTWKFQPPNLIKALKRNIHQRTLRRQLLPYILLVLLVVPRAALRHGDHGKYTMRSAIERTIVMQKVSIDGGKSVAAWPELTKPTHFMEWIRGALLPLVYLCSESKVPRLNENLYIPFKFRLRQLRSFGSTAESANDGNERCTVSSALKGVEFTEGACYPDYSVVYSQTWPIPLWQPHVEGFGADITLRDARINATFAKWEVLHYTALETRARPYEGRLADLYAGSGFTVDLPILNYNKTRLMVEGLDDGKFIDLATRAVFLQMAFFNEANDLLASTKLVFEMNAGGQVATSFSVGVSRIDGLQTAAEGWVALTFTCIVVCVGFYFSYDLFYVRVYHELCFHSFYLDDVLWLVADALTLFLIWADLILRCWRWSEVDPELGHLMESFTTRGWFDPDRLIWIDSLADTANALMLLVCSWQPLRFIELDPAFKVISLTLQYTATVMSRLFVVTLIIFAGFVFAAHLIFGGVIAEYSSLSKAFVRLARTITGDADFEKLAEARPEAAVQFIFAFVACFFIVAANLFASSVLDAWDTERTFFTSRYGAEGMWIIPRFRAWIKRVREPCIDLISTRRAVLLHFRDFFLCTWCRDNENNANGVMTSGAILRQLQIVFQNLPPDTDVLWDFDALQGILGTPANPWSFDQMRVFVVSVRDARELVRHTTKVNVGGSAAAESDGEVAEAWSVMAKSRTAPSMQLQTQAWQDEEVEALERLRVLRRRMNTLMCNEVALTDTLCSALAATLEQQQELITNLEILESETRPFEPENDEKMEMLSSNFTRLRFRP